MNTEKKVLWIDDFINNARMSGQKGRVERKGFRITPAATIDEALDLLQDTSHKWAGIIIDIAIPPDETRDGFGPGETENGLTAGYVLLKKIKENENFTHSCDIPIIVFTQVNNDDLWRYCESKNIPFLRKRGNKKIEDAAQEYFQG